MLVCPLPLREQTAVLFTLSVLHGAAIRTLLRCALVPYLISADRAAHVRLHCVPVDFIVSDFGKYRVS